jgi:molybdopterin-guanine dinucleotide biosynthesis protein A
MSPSLPLGGAMAHDVRVTWAAVILTGGSGRRLGGADKAALELDGRRLLDRAVAAVDGAAEVVVVGPESETEHAVRFVQESPAGGGPLAGLAAGVAALEGEHDRVVVLAVDMPQVHAGTVTRLLEATEGVDAAWLTDDSGRRQLAGALRPSVVPSPAEAHAAPMRTLMLRENSRDVPALGEEAADVDTWDDLARLRREPPEDPTRVRT